MKTKLTKMIPDLVFAIIIFSSISMGYPLVGKILLTIYFLYLIYKSLPAIYATAGGNAYKKGNKEKALTYFKKAANSKKSKANFISSYGYLLLRDGKVSESEPYLEKAVELDDNLPQIKYSSLLNLSLLRWKQGRIPEAIKIAEDLKPNYLNSVVYEVLGYYYISNGDYEKAKAFNEEALLYDEDDDVIKDNMAQTHYFLSEYEEAEKIYSKIVPDVAFPEAYYYYALIKIEMGEIDEARKLLEVALTKKVSFMSNINEEIITTKLDELNNLSELKSIDKQSNLDNSNNLDDLHTQDHLEN
ncbi:tetratricopeptide repeat protein [Clostridium algidicarnis]|uniref:tetratricopeptide repeat protein n=1 Tax=Clostridium algidicarnis TaxID=37659 RepID=UPI001C0CAB81|nr:tetratricopeptide repeat protein [Clostridium algidicarnis]MBU3192774.1 tetratricopeptide repeat protein [Clostridium algidicarnis]